MKDQVGYGYMASDGYMVHDQGCYSKFGTSVWDVCTHSSPCQMALHPERKHLDFLTALLVSQVLSKPSLEDQLSLASPPRSSGHSASGMSPIPKTAIGLK